jgi:hypothetical protein
MNPLQIVTLVFGLALAVACVAWARAELKRDKASRRFALISGPYGGGTVWVVLPVVVLLAPLFYVLFAFELVPKGSPGLFALTFGWATVACIATIIAGITVQVRRNALGWITLVGDDTLEVEAEGKSATLRLQAGDVRLYFISPEGRYVQIVIDTDAARLKVWGMISLRGIKDVTEGGFVAAEGLMLAGAFEPLRKWLSPYIVRN